MFKKIIIGVAVSFLVGCGPSVFVKPKFDAEVVPNAPTYPGNKLSSNAKKLNLPAGYNPGWFDWYDAENVIFYLVDKDIEKFIKTPVIMNINTGEVSELASNDHRRLLLNLNKKYRQFFKDVTDGVSSFTNFLSSIQGGGSLYTHYRAYVKNLSGTREVQLDVKDNKGSQLCWVNGNDDNIFRCSISLTPKYLTDDGRYIFDGEVFIDVMNNKIHKSLKVVSQDRSKPPVLMYYAINPVFTKVIFIYRDVGDKWAFEIADYKLPL